MGEGWDREPVEPIVPVEGQTGECEVCGEPTFDGARFCWLHEGW